MFEGLIGFVLGIGLTIYAFRELNRKACLRVRKDRSGTWDVQPKALEVRMLLIGDTGSGDENQKQVAQSSAHTAQELGADLVLMLGDNFIMDGVESLADPQFQEKFEKIYPHPLPFYPVLGNHDFRGSWRAQVDYTEINPRWKMPDVDYNFRAGPVQLFALNTTCTFCSLARLFEKRTAPWKVVFGHRPFYTDGRHRGMVGLERWWIKRSRPDFYFAGHNHLLEHWQTEGLDLITSGGGGSPLHPIDIQTSEDNRYLYQGHGYVWAHFTENRAEFRFFAHDGKELYRFEREK